MENHDRTAPQDFPESGQDFLSKLVDEMFEDGFRGSLVGKPPPDGYELWGYKLVRSDRSAGGELRWPTEEMLVESGLSDGSRDGATSPGTLAIACEIADVGLTSSVGGSVLLTLAYNRDDVIDERDGGLVLVRRAYVADADITGFNLSSGVFREDRRYRAFEGLDVSELKDRERASFLGPEPPEFPGLDTRRRVRAEAGSGDWLAAAVSLYRQPPNDPCDLALALAGLAQDKTVMRQFANVTAHSQFLQYALPWERQVAVQRRIDGYLLEHFGRVDPRSEDPERPMGHAEQWLHTIMHGAQFLNLAETLIEYDIDYDDIAEDDSYRFLRRLVPSQSPSRVRTAEPRLTAGPVYLTGLGDDDVPRCPELNAVYLPTAGRPRLARIEADGPCSLRIRQLMVGGALTQAELDPQTRMLLRAGASSDTGVPENAIATELAGRYAGTAPAGPVRGNAVIVGVRDDCMETDAPGSIVRKLAGLGYPVAVSDDE